MKNLLILLFVFFVIGAIDSSLMHALIFLVGTVAGVFGGLHILLKMLGG